MAVATIRTAQTGAPFSIRAILPSLVAIVFGTFMAIFDMTAVNVALPTLERALHSNLQLIQWTITGYVLAQAAVIPLSGWLADRYGAKRVYLAALALFTLGSALCATAVSGEQLVVFRVMQGLGGGMLMPLGMSFVFRLAPPERRGAVMGIYGIPILLGPALGPVVSGWLVQYADWRFVFLINVPVGIAAVVIGLRALPNLVADRAPGALDRVGAVLGPLAFAALTYGISESTSATWTGAPTLIGLGVGAVALVAFVVWELRGSAPLLELRVFKSVDFSLALVTQWLVATSLFGSLFLVALFLQQARGYGPLDAGVTMLPQAIGAGLFITIGGRIFDRLGARPTVLTGTALIAAGLWFLSRVSGTTSSRDLIVPLFIWGAGMGLSMLPLSTQILSSAPRELVSRVTSLTGALQNVVISLAVATYATILQGRIPVHLAAVKTGVERYAGNPVHGALAASFDDVFRLGLIVALAAVAFSLTLRRASSAQKPGEEEVVAVEDIAVVA